MRGTAVFFVMYQLIDKWGYWCAIPIKRGTLFSSYIEQERDDSFIHEMTGSYVRYDWFVCVPFVAFIRVTHAYAHLHTSIRNIRAACCALQHTVISTLQLTHCNTLLNFSIATLELRNTLQLTAKHCNMHCNKYTATHFHIPASASIELPATHCNKRTLTHCNTLSHASIRNNRAPYDTPQHTLRDTLQHTATHCNTLCKTLSNISIHNTRCNTQRDNVVYWKTNRKIMNDLQCN